MASGSGEKVRLTLSGTWGHFKTITIHRMRVCKYCFKMGLYYQGLTHDLSKYSPTEFFVGARYYQGFRSPNAKERDVKGYSSSWLHHKGRNKHHFEYWVDFTGRHSLAPFGCYPARMPDRYIAEMLADRVAASATYKGNEYKSSDPLEYYLTSKPEELPIHPYTRQKLEEFLYMLADKGEEETFRYIRTVFLKK
ncbi:DUF5662 family protein [Butyrivibrio sp. MC2013]|uniref:DUF5662 family protein n=1 Tax=Butyrivibrio sp. MC2013 TaxID=1280686 RepID=UPI000684D5F7